MNSATSSETQDFTSQAKKAALSRWKLETLTGLLAYRGANHHQREQQKNVEAENKRVRKELWGDDGKASESGEDMGTTVLGDYHPPQVIIAGQQQSSGLGQLLGAALAGASLLGIPGAGVAAYLYGKSQAEPAKPNTQVIEQREDLGLGLLKLEDLKQ